MGNHPMNLRVLALTCFFLAHSDIHLAIQYYIDGVPKSQYSVVHDVRSFILNNVKKFKETGSLADKPHPPREKKLPDEVALECAKTLKHGYTIYQPDAKEEGVGQLVHQWYTTISQACRENPYLASVCSEYGVSPKALLRRMHQVDPNLVYRSLDFKRELTTEQKHKRQAVATELYNSWCSIPNFLQSIFWIDEVSFWFCPHYTKHNVKVYCDAHDEEIRHVIHSPLFKSSVKKGEKIQVRALCVVNMLTGPFFLEFTTGTNDIQRQHIAPQTYKVC